MQLIASLFLPGRYVLTELEQRADVSVALNGHEVATLTTGLSSHSKQGRAVITPIFTVTYRGNDVVKVSGELLFLCHLTLETTVSVC